MCAVVFAWLCLVTATVFLAPFAMKLVFDSAHTTFNVLLAIENLYVAYVVNIFEPPRAIMLNDEDVVFFAQALFGSAILYTVVMGVFWIPFVREHCAESNKRLRQERREFEQWQRERKTKRKSKEDVC